MFQSKMVTTAIPERVYALCKLIEKQPLTSAEAKEKMEPAFLKQNSVYYYDYKLAAEELQLITTIDSTMTLAIDPLVLKSMDSMRAYVNRQLSRYKEGQFYCVTKAYYSLGEKILQGEQNVANMASTISDEANLPVDSVAMRAWRFWASYLGFGYLIGMFLMPNADIFLWDLIQGAGFEREHKYTINEFLNQIRPHSDIIINPTASQNTFNLGVSNGLRTLQDKGLITMENIMDQGDVWNLYHIDALKMNETLTHISIAK